MTATTTLDRPIIGVVTPTERHFREWVNEIGREHFGAAQFVQISKVDDVMERRFHRVELGFSHYMVPVHIYMAAQHRIISAQ